MAADVAVALVIVFTNNINHLFFEVISIALNTYICIHMVNIYTYENTHAILAIKIYYYPVVFLSSFHSLLYRL